MVGKNSKGEKVMMGRVKTIKPSMYGFILDEQGNEYFFHAQSYKGNWEDLQAISPPQTHKGPVVQFTPTTSPKGLRAENVEFINEF
jgi:cold shock CspA family protein